MIKKNIKLVLFLLAAILICGLYLIFKSTEHSRFAEKAYKILINVPETGLEANKKQLEDIIKYADKLEKKGDLESIRLCFALRETVMLTLFSEKQKAEKIHFGYNLPTNNPVSIGFNKDLFLNLCEMNHFNETELIERLPVDNNSIISNLYAANISVPDILSYTDSTNKILFINSLDSIFQDDLYERFTDLQQELSILTLNPVMKTSDEQFVQSLSMIQNFRDLYIHAEVYRRYGFIWEYKKLESKIDEIIQERGIVKRVDTFRPEKSSKI